MPIYQAIVEVTTRITVEVDAPDIDIAREMIDDEEYDIVSEIDTDPEIKPGSLVEINESVS